MSSFATLTFDAAFAPRRDAAFEPSRETGPGASVHGRSVALTETMPAAQGRTEDSRTLAGLLLAAALAALLVVANQVIDTWIDGHWLAAWVALWTLAFVGLAFLAAPLRRVASYGAQAFVQWRSAARARRMEEKMWEFAKHDPRIMAELRMAVSREAAQG